MKKTALITTFMLFAITTYACPECEKQQPKILRGIAHGAGPESQWDYVIIWSVVAIVVATLFFAVKWTIRPGEKNMNHIKRTIINFE